MGRSPEPTLTPENLRHERRERRLQSLSGTHEADYAVGPRWTRRPAARATCGASLTWSTRAACRRRPRRRHCPAPPCKVLLVPSADITSLSFRICSASRHCRCPALPCKTILTCDVLRAAALTPACDPSDLQQTFAAVSIAFKDACACCLNGRLHVIGVGISTKCGFHAADEATGSAGTSASHTRTSAHLRTLPWMGSNAAS